MTNTKRNTKKAPVDALQGDKAQSGTGGTTTVTTKTTRVASTAKTATEQIKKPTLASLQKEADNLTQQLVYANQQVLRLEDEVRVSWEYYAELSDRSLSLIIYQRFRDWLYRVTKNFRE